MEVLRRFINPHPSPSPPSAYADNSVLYWDTTADDSLIAIFPEQETKAVDLVSPVRFTDVTEL